MKKLLVLALFVSFVAFAAETKVAAPTTPVVAPAAKVEVKKEVVKKHKKHKKAVKKAVVAPVANSNSNVTK